MDESYVREEKLVVVSFLICKCYILYCFENVCVDIICKINKFNINMTYFEDVNVY